MSGSDVFFNVKKNVGGSEQHCRQKNGTVCHQPKDFSHSFMTFILRSIFLFDSSRGSTMVRCLDPREEKLPKIKDLESEIYFNISRSHHH